MLFSVKTLRRIAAAVCALAVLLSAGCGNGDDDSVNATTAGTTIADGTKDSLGTGEGSAAVDTTTELVTTPVALEPQEMGVNITSDVPVEYTMTLLDYYAMVTAIVNDEVVDNEDGTYSSPHYPYPMISYSLSEAVKVMENITMDTFGYALRDIDKNGSPELILMCDNNAMLEIYTIFDGEVKIATFFWPSFTGVLDEEGNLYTEMLKGSNMMDHYAIETLGTDVGYFDATRRLSRTIPVESGEDTEISYYEQKADEEIPITKAEFEDFVASFPEIPKFTDTKGTHPDNLGFIPINVVK